MITQSNLNPKQIEEMVKESRSKLPTIEELEKMFQDNKISELRYWVTKSRIFPDDLEIQLQAAGFIMKMPW